MPNETNATRFINVARQLALTSPHPYYRMGAIVVRKNRIMGMGVNQNKTHPRSPQRIWKTIHAELAALMRSGVSDGADLYVVRVNKRGELRTSRPCLDCASLLAEAGIRRVGYVLGNELVLDTV